jgi:DNA-binding NtrC family response regulator
MFRCALVESLTGEGFQVDEAANAQEALSKLSQNAYDVLVTDLALPDSDGIEVLAEGKARSPEMIAILMTGYATVESAVEAMKRGAYDYLIKPFPLIQLPTMIRKGQEEARLRVENQYLRRQLDQKYSFNNIIGTAPSMRRIFDLIESVSRLSTTVLIQGETGTGKELIAKAIHHNSPRRDQRMVSLNCGAIPENLLESELFGHVKGAFTGAFQSRVGRFEQANGGTLFLDEIGNMPTSLQVKLLRVIQEREFERVGANTTVKVDVRIIAATSADLSELVELGKFREDLYYRLNVIPLTMPPLRERREDIPFLFQKFVQNFCSKHGFEPKTATPEVMKALMAFPWPGNVRQLENTVERMVALTGNRAILTSSDLPDEVQKTVRSGVAPLIDIPETGINLQGLVSDMERELILQSLRRTNGNKKLAAELLSLKRTTLIQKMKRIRLEEHAVAAQ